MSKMIEYIKELAKEGNEVVVLLPGIGSARAKVEDVDDDIVILARVGKPKVVIHYTQFVVQTS
jgi:hypothetical protein